MREIRVKCVNAKNAPFIQLSPVAACGFPQSFFLWCGRFGCPSKVSNVTKLKHQTVEWPRALQINCVWLRSKDRSSKKCQARIA